MPSFEEMLQHNASHRTLSSLFLTTFATQADFLAPFMAETCPVCHYTMGEHPTATYMVPTGDKRYDLEHAIACFQWTKRFLETIPDKSYVGALGVLQLEDMIAYAEEVKEVLQ